MTYHGPGQLVVYVMLDVKRRGFGIRELVRRLEFAVIDLLAEYAIEANGDCHAPGVYVRGKKIAALGLRIRHGATYHGIALNVDMDLTPFSGINPCGFAGLNVTQLTEQGISLAIDDVADTLLPHLVRRLELSEGKT